MTDTFPDAPKGGHVLTEWQPIETAPRDKRILLFGPDGVDIGSFVDWLSEDEWRRDQTAEYNNDGATIGTPTHWMPLPEPPHAN